MLALKNITFEKAKMKLLLYSKAFCFYNNIFFFFIYRNIDRQNFDQITNFSIHQRKNISNVTVTSYAIVYFII